MFFLSRFKFTDFLLSIYSDTLFGTLSSCRSHSCSRTHTSCTPYHKRTADTHSSYESYRPPRPWLSYGCAAPPSYPPSSASGGSQNEPSASTTSAHACKSGEGQCPPCLPKNYKSGCKCSKNHWVLSRESEWSCSELSKIIINLSY